MSFAEQERVLFDLLFNHALRDQFLKDKEAALALYDLDEGERRDFNAIRPHALELDAKMRADLILSNLCKLFPLSFSILSSVDNGMDTLKELINLETMQSSALERATAFANQLRQKYPNLLFTSEQEQRIASAILEAELAMAWTSASLKQTIINNEKLPQLKAVDFQNDLQKPVKLAAYVCAGILPQSYAQLKRDLCSVSLDELWRHLSNKPLAVARRSKILKTDDPKLLLARATVSHVSNCEPAVDQKTIELSEGFASLFEHINGTMSVAEILQHLKAIGAPGELLTSIESAFKQLLENGMLEVV